MMTLSKGFLLTFAMLIFCQHFSEAKNIVRKPSQAENLPIQIKVIYGEKITLFSIAKTKSNGRVEFSNNSGAKDSKDISLKDYDFLKNKISKISGTSNDKSFCIRNYITINLNNRELVGCIGAPNNFAREIQETTNLVSVLF